MAAMALAACYLVVRGVQGQILVHDLLYGCAVAERNQRFGKVRFSHTGHLIKGILCLFGKNDAEFFLQVVQTEPELLHALVMSFEQDVLKRGTCGVIAVSENMTFFIRGKAGKLYAGEKVQTGQIH